MASKSSKAGRNRPGCKAYLLSHRREHNKIKRLKKHLLREPNDKIAAKAIDMANVAIRGY